MKYLKLFEGYQSESEVSEICKKLGIENWPLVGGNWIATSTKK